MDRKNPTSKENRTAQPSKSQLKREMLELQSLGESLIDFGDGELAELPLPDSLVEAIHDARRMKKRGALHRQKQLIGKLMRNVDAQPIREALAKKQAQARVATARFHRAEEWRDRLVRDGDAAMERLVADYPAADRQHLRRLMRDAAAERKAGKAPRASRQLFRYINELLE